MIEMTNRDTGVTSLRKYCARNKLKVPYLQNAPKEVILAWLEEHEPERCAWLKDGQPSTNGSQPETTSTALVVRQDSVAALPVDQLIAAVEQRGAERNHMLGKNAHEPAFIAGAATVMEALGLWNDVPPKWLFNAMAGQPVFENGHVRPALDYDEAKATLLEALEEMEPDDDETRHDFYDRRDEAKQAVLEVFPR